MITRSRASVQLRATPKGSEIDTMNESTNPLLIVLITCWTIVALRPMWRWAEDEHPTLRRFGQIGLAICIGAFLFGTLFFSDKTTAALIAISSPVAVICVGWIIIHFLWILVLVSWRIIAVVSLAFLLTGIGMFVFTDTGWIDYWHQARWYLFAASVVWYILACYLSGIDDAFWIRWEIDEDAFRKGEAEGISNIQKKQAKRIQDKKDMDRQHQDAEDNKYFE